MCRDGARFAPLRHGRASCGSLPVFRAPTVSAQPLARQPALPFRAHARCPAPGFPGNDASANDQVRRAWVRAKRCERKVLPRVGTTAIMPA